MQASRNQEEGEAAHASGHAAWRAAKDDDGASSGCNVSGLMDGMRETKGRGGWPPWILWFSGETEVKISQNRSPGKFQQIRGNPLGNQDRDLKQPRVEL
jgi:hypothetical protein